MRSQVGNYSSLNSTVVHNLGEPVKAGIFLGGTTGTPANAAYTPFSMQFSTGTNGLGLFWNVVSIAATARVYSSQSNKFNIANSTATTLSVAVNLTSFTSVDFVSSVGGSAPVVYGLMGGTEVQSRVALVSLSTSTGLQNSTGYGFQPNCALFLGRSTGTSQDAWSLGCQIAGAPTSGSSRGWVISQTLREGAIINSFKDCLSTGMVPIKLETTAGPTPQYSAFVSSFAADGLRFTVDNVDTARAASVAVLALSVPKAVAGASSVIGNQLSVTGLGPLTNSVLVASQANLFTAGGAAGIHYSVGIASSDGSQGSVSGLLKEGSAPAGGMMSAMSTFRCLQFLTTGGIQVGGILSVSTDGFVIDFNTTNASGFIVYWLAFLNDFTNISGTALSSYSLSGFLTSIIGMGSSVGSSFTFGSSISSVFAIGSSLYTSFILGSSVSTIQGVGVNVPTSIVLSGGLQGNFIPGRGKIGAKADMDIRLAWGRDRHHTKIVSTDSPASQRTITVTTTPYRIGVGELGNTKILGLLPASSNTYPYRVKVVQSQLGSKLAPTGLSVLNLSTESRNDLYLVSSVTGASIPMRVLLR